MIAKNIDKTYRIPMKESIRSINLATAVSAVLYEAIRHTRIDGRFYE